MEGDIWAIWERVRGDTCSDTCSESLEDRGELLECT